MKNNFNCCNNIKLFLLTSLIIIYLIIYINEFITNNEFERKLKILFPLQEKFINNYLSNISKKYYIEKRKETFSLISLISLLNYSDISNNTLKNKIRQELLNELDIKHQNKNLSEIKSVYVEKSYKFGNAMVLLNNLLYYCEILNITNIYLNSEKEWPISHNIISDKFNITLISRKKMDYINRDIIIFDKRSIYFQRVIKPKIRINLLKNEIKKNLPKIEINKNDLFIHIRSGDIFKLKTNMNINYAQPPLCFYQTIIKNFSFNQIYIISQDKENPIIDILNKKFPEIIITNNQLKKDITILMNAYSIVGSISSFFTTILILNDNLETLFEFDNYRLTSKFLHLHREIYNYHYRYKVYKMYPSLQYKTKMFPWINSREQINLMINEKCNKFELST